MLYINETDIISGPYTFISSYGLFKFPVSMQWDLVLLLRQILTKQITIETHSNSIPIHMTAVKSCVWHSNNEWLTSLMGLLLTDSGESHVYPSGHC
ncbi:hypothetical protein GDO78_006322 [Eleutherodactylus coqui]|uniref:Uncharacterized protein n=1 Tax=Eleutherodactylus coqui TaxID=57060 RepID=A0A8J6FNC8_ELECQ|nr:hypothetical protein GDO78_006322 [Eleutherodactylus coqui]